MTALEFLTQHRELTAAQIAEATGQHIEHVYAELVQAEANGLARVNTDKLHRCTWELMALTTPLAGPLSDGVARQQPTKEQTQ